MSGNLLDREYDVNRRGEKLAEAPKKWFHTASTSGVVVDAGEDRILNRVARVALGQSSGRGAPFR